MNASKDKALAPKEIQFGACLARILKKIWEANPEDGPVWFTKWYISDAFHRCNLRPTDIGNFTYAVPPLPANPTVIICIDLVLLMGWVNSPEFFCSASETVSDNGKSYALDLSSIFDVYPPTSGAYKTVDAQTASPGLRDKGH